MREHLDANERTGSAITHDRMSLGGIDAAKLLKGAAIGAFLGAGVAYVLHSMRLSEEPPIRVKGGSADFELLDSTIYWVDEGAKKKWGLSDGTKIGDEYTVVVRIFKRADQTFYGRKITVYVGADQKDEKVIELKANNQKTKLKSDDPLDYKGNNKQVLTHPLDISKIKLDGDVIYDPSAGTLDEMLIYP